MNTDFKNYEEYNKWLSKASNEDLFKVAEKTDSKIIPTQFLTEYDYLISCSGSKYGKASELLENNLKNINKEDLVIIDILNKDIEKENLDNKIINFIPFDKIFIQTSIPFISIENRFCMIDSLILIRDQSKKAIYIHYLIKYIKERKTEVGYHKFNEDEINLELSIKDTTKIGKEKCEGTTIENGFIRGKKIMKIIRYLSHKINTHEYRTYKKYDKGKLIEKEIVYSSEVRSHKRHFWKDSGKFKIPLMKKEEWEEKGYGTDGAVFKDNELRINIPYLIIGQFLKNKELKKENRKISLIKKKVWKCEEKIYLILKELFPNNYIRRHDRKTLNGLELDFNLPELRLGIEYDGEQHFNRKLCEEVFKSDFDAQVKRDRDKNKRCVKKNITLIRIKFDEPLTKTHIKNKLKRFLK